MKLAILISGSGSNLQAFIDSVGRGDINAEIALVLSNRADAYGLERASSAGISTTVSNHRDYEQREEFDRAMVEALAAHDIDLVILAGFMRILTPVFINAYRGRLMNVHPSLLPKYPGLNTHQRAIDAGDSRAGATVHFVTEELDGGPPIVNAAVDILPTDNAQTLADRVLLQEHRIYPLAARWFVDKRLTLTSNGAQLDGKPIPASGIASED